MKKKEAKKKNKIILKPIRPSYAIELHYYRRIRSLIKNMSSDYRKEIELVFRKDGLDAALAKVVVDNLNNRFTTQFIHASNSLANAFVEQSSVASGAAFKKATATVFSDFTLNPDILQNELKEVLTASIQANVSLIKSIGSEYLTQVEGAVMRSIAGGGGLETLIPFLQQYEGVSLRRAKLIATDQTKKLYADLGRARAMAAGIKEFQWLHVAGSVHPRKWHEHLSGKIFRYDDPPVIDEKTGERGFPGQLINCKCLAQFVMSFEK